MSTSTRRDSKPWVMHSPQPWREWASPDLTDRGGQVEQETMVESKTSRTSKTGPGKRYTDQFKQDGRGGKPAPRVEGHSPLADGIAGGMTDGLATKERRERKDIEKKGRNSLPSSRACRGISSVSGGKKAGELILRQAQDDGLFLHAAWCVVFSSFPSCTWERGEKGIAGIIPS